MVSAMLAIALALRRGDRAALRQAGPGEMLPIMALFILPATETIVLIAATFGAKVVRVAFFVRSLGEPVVLIVAALVAYKLGGARRLGVRAHDGEHARLRRGVRGHLLRVRARVGDARAAAPRHPRLVRFALPVAGSELGNTVLRRPTS
jgi:hypothetical protein